MGMMGHEKPNECRNTFSTTFLYDLSMFFVGDMPLEVRLNS